jgi:VWFA-related protein
MAVISVASAQEQPFQGSVEVNRVITQVRVVGFEGNPVVGLTAENFRVWLEGDEVEVEVAEWISADRSEVEIEEVAIEATLDPGPDLAVPAPASQGRLIVILFQTDFFRTRMIGIMRMARRVDEFLDNLNDADRVALAVMGSHLQLRCDFTSDLESLKGETRLVELLESQTTVEAEKPPAMADSYDAEAGREAASLEDALLVIAESLRDIPGEKSLVLFGWGMSRYSRLTKNIPGYEEARDALAAADVTVFVLDITHADYHTLEEGLRSVAEDTGGVYFKTHIFPDLAMEHLEKALEGYYELTLNVPPLPVGEPCRMKVRIDRKRVSVLAPPTITVGL